MAKWEYDLKENGKKLRELIRSGDSSKENCEKILNQMIFCCNELQIIFTDKDKNLYQLDIEDFIQDCEDTKYYLDAYDEESNEGNINDILNDFYDLMDSIRVWVGI